MDSSGILLILIVLNVLVSIKGFNDYSFFRKYQFHMGSIQSGEQYRMLTSGFLHADMAHLAFNMLALYSFADVVLQLMGTFSFVLIYFASLLFGNMLTVFFHKNNYNYTAVGASGAVTGIIFSAILLFPNMPINILFIPIDIPGYIFGVIYLLYSIYGMKANTDNIGHTAHIGGAIGGYIFTLLKAHYVLTDNLFVVVILAIPIIIMFVMAKQGKL
ncbi:rhomboid family intramembrane serine protease [Flavobacterium aciduliphilum]|uniref:Membrane associated rhomboid family serine protease n=1 Tax=Flavobacterium aciduliphilum TaxID=1101402 RepID=A0A328YIX4_9FLAO|nr:rhomboid family intramembrane serine protease [Flavobacterium aciduliphilum]RAR73919.1 membrane associated rhomboid family serine protease [Flavobacterium aciduliphilum]